QLYPLGAYSSALFAALVVITLTAINILGVRFGTGTQNLLFAVEFLGTLCVVVVGLFIHPSPEHLSALPVASENTTSTGLAMVLVLLPFGGWNEAGYLSGALKAGSRKMVWVLVVSILVTTVLYLLVDWAFFRALGIERMAASEAVGIDLMQATLGEPGVY